MSDIFYLDAFLLIIIVVSAAFIIKKLSSLLKIISFKFDRVQEKISSIEKDDLRIENAVREEFSSSRIEYTNSLKQLREELSVSLKVFGDSMLKRMNDIAIMQKNQLETFANQLSNLTIMNEEKFGNVTNVIQSRLEAMRNGNEKKLDEMRMVVDEKLDKTIAARIGSSFKIVSERLEAVHKGLGDMQHLANGVGDLKRVLTNVKTRGVMGEYQLANILEQMLSPNQYAANVKIKKEESGFVEYAVKLPGRDSSTVWLPIDSKFPIETYQRLSAAYDDADKESVLSLRTEFKRAIKLSAKEIKNKYIDPPNTTDFAVMFLPIEGLYMEVLRDPGLFSLLKAEYKIVVAGPTTLSALLSSLQMGFKTLAIEKRSSEVWNILSGVKTEFGKFGQILQKTQKKIEEASNTLADADIRTRAIARKLRGVEEGAPAIAKTANENSREPLSSK